MCGLFGAWGWSQQLDTTAALKALKSRGPDDQGEFHDPCGLSLLHTRLAIQDLSPLGHQPMITSDQSLALVFNGEIYNQHKLRRELEAAGYNFRSLSDTEVLLHGFRHWKQDLWHRLEGIFAVACWEPHDQRLTLARDRFGVKPLLWQRKPQRLAFASELSALLASGCCHKAALNPRAIGSYLLWGSVSAPNTIVDGVQVFPAGHWASCQLGQSWQLRRFSPEQSPAQRSDLNLSAATEQTRLALQRAVQHQSIGDRPVGLFLSGGLDSGLLAAELRHQQEGAIHSVSVGFDGLPGAVDETDLAGQTAQALGLTHQRLGIGPQQLDHSFDGFLEAIDQPSIDGFNSHLVTQAARDQGMVVAFSGLGADELFGGYSHMQPGPLEGQLQARRLKLHSITQQSRQDLEHTRSCGLPSDLSLSQCSELELRGYLHDTLLRDSDAVSMAQGLELRVPFLDSELVDLALSIPAELHRAEGPKTLLRRLAGGQLPDAVLNAPKRGFNLALAPWLLQHPRFNPRRIWSLLAKQTLQLSRRSFWGSWIVLRLSGRYKPYWRYVVLAEWLAQ
jgi:asparagine synthase (glutamine-hydrolysing)